MQIIVSILLVLLAGSVQAGYKYTRWLSGDCSGTVYSRDFYNDLNIPNGKTDGACTSYGSASEKYESMTEPVYTAPKLSEASSVILYYLDAQCAWNASRISVTMSNGDGRLPGTSVFACSESQIVESKPDGSSVTTQGNCSPTGFYYAKTQCNAKEGSSDAVHVKSVMLAAIIPLALVLAVMF